MSTGVSNVLIQTIIDSFYAWPPITVSDPCSTELHSAPRLVDCAVETGKIAGDFMMFGHRQTKPEGGTECPGDSLYSTIQTWPHWVSALYHHVLS